MTSTKNPALAKSTMPPMAEMMVSVSHALGLRRATVVGGEDAPRQTQQPGDMAGEREEGHAEEPEVGLDLGQQPSSRSRPLTLGTSQ